MYFCNALVRTNYRNPSKGIDPNKSFLAKFFRNLMLGEHHELKNRYMLIGYSDVDDTPIQVPIQALMKQYLRYLKNIKRLIIAIGTDEKSVREIMEVVGLKNRPNFLEYSLTPALQNGLVTMKYPNSPRHPRQKYILTVEGLEVYNRLNSKPFDDRFR